MFERCVILVVLAHACATPAVAQEPPLRDPMRPFAAAPDAGGETSASQRLTLTGVLISESRRIAVINNRFYRVGDRVDGAEIVRTEPGSMRIRRGSEEVLITLREERVVTVESAGVKDQ